MRFPYTPAHEKAYDTSPRFRALWEDMQAAEAELNHLKSVHRKAQRQLHLRLCKIAGQLNEIAAAVSRGDSKVKHEREFIEGADGRLGPVTNEMVDEAIRACEEQGRDRNRDNPRQLSFPFMNDDELKDERD